MFQNNHVRLSDEGVIGYLLIADDAVLSAHINDAQVLTAHILDAQITSAKLAAASVATSIVCEGLCLLKIHVTEPLLNEKIFPEKLLI